MFIFTKFSVHVNYDHDLILCLHCNKLCTSGFRDGIMFSHNGGHQIRDDCEICTYAMHRCVL